MRFITAVTLATVMLWVPVVDGVAQRNPLKGLTTMGHSVLVTWDDRIEGKSEAQYRQELETAFELGLLRTGIKLDDESLSYLFCSVRFLPTTEGLTISLALTVEYNEGVVPLEVALSGTATVDEHWQVATTWSADDVGTVGADRLSGTPHGERCAEHFELAWRRANN